MVSAQSANGPRETGDGDLPLTTITRVVPERRAAGNVCVVCCVAHATRPLLTFGTVVARRFARGRTSTHHRTSDAKKGVSGYDLP